jgi:formylglycine-generating enzyme required for sulfatase activity
VIAISALAFLAKLDWLKDGYHYLLPTEAELEYASMGGIGEAMKLLEELQELE